MTDQLEFDLAPVTWAALQVLDCSAVLTSTEKRVLFKIYGMGKASNGCFASLGTLALRLGIPDRTVEDVRTRLRKLGLLEVRRRKGKPAVWRVMITKDAIPPDPAKVDPDDYLRFRERVDNWLSFQQRRHIHTRGEEVKPVPARVDKPVRARVRAIRGCIEEEPLPPPEGEVFHKHQQQHVSKAITEYMERTVNR